MAINLDISSPALLRTSFLTLLLFQVQSPFFNRNSDYKYPSDYLTTDKYTFMFMSHAVQTFDYIVVGTGPSGSAIAYRLALEDPSKKVLAIEAGEDPTATSIVPRFFPFNMKNKASFDYVAEPSPKYANAYENNQLQCDAGKMLGGGSGMNSFLWACGTKTDYTKWAEAANNDWNYDTMLTYIKKIMTQSDESLTTGRCANNYGTSGPLYIGVMETNYHAKELGYEELPDINCELYNGLSHMRGTVKGGERHSSAIAYLNTLRTRDNFYIMKNSVVNKILTTRDSEGKVTVTGVNVVTNQPGCLSFDLVVTRETILSAGGYNSPRILQRSGIGRNVDLNPLRIPQVLDLNVGYNYQDHMTTWLYISLPTEQEGSLQNTIAYVLQQAKAYMENPRRGDFTSFGTLSWSAFYNLSTTDINEDPDIQLMFYHYDLQQFEMQTILVEKFRLKQKIANQLIKINQSHTILAVLIALLNPKSRGTVKLRDADPFSSPLIDMNFMSDADDEDKRKVVKAVELVKKFVETETMMSVKASLITFDLPNCNQSYWDCHIAHFTGIVRHPKGTCKMGKVSDADAVVDPALKVIGIHGPPYLRVADGSIMPTITSGNTQCPCYAIGERTADFIINNNK